MPEANRPFRTWNGVEPHPFRPGIAIKAIGGDQVLVCHVTYAPGTSVPRHAHDETEQVMVITGGELTMTIGGETQTLAEGDVAVVSRGVEHEVHSEGGCTFLEALAPVPLDHVPQPARDIVAGPEGGSGHVPR